MNKDIEFLKELQEELKTQDRDCQAAPRFWTIGDYRYEPCGEGCEDDTFVNWPNGEFFDTIDELKELIGDNYSDGSVSDEELERLISINCADEAVDWIRDNFGDSAYATPVEHRHIIIPNTMFLTKKEAKEHIRMNHHHYTSKVHTYAMTAWRAPKVARLLKILESFDWGSISEEV